MVREPFGNPHNQHKPITNTHRCMCNAALTTSNEYVMLHMGFPNVLAHTMYY